VKLIEPKIIDDILNEFESYKFTTQEFIKIFKQKKPRVYKRITNEYGLGGKGTGNYYSSNVHIAKSLSNHSGLNPVSFVNYIKAPKSWGNSVIALWECNPNNIETVRASASLRGDISEIINNSQINNTDKETLVLSRIGQGKFRNNLIAYWGGCAVTGCEEIQALVASHIKPWSECNNEERLDTFNGFLLTPNLDRLFDKGIITFSKSGKIIISSFISSESKMALCVNSKMTINLSKEHQYFLEYHRDYIFETKAKNT